MEIKERNVYFDFLRGIAIIMVVFIHSFPSTYTNFELFFRQLLNIAVPLFLAISGFFMAKKNVENKENYLLFIKKQIPKVYLPMLIWSIPALYIEIKSGGVSMSKILLFFVGGLSIYYFVFLIVQYYVLLPFLKNYIIQKSTEK